MKFLPAIARLPETSYDPGEEVISEGGNPDRLFFLKEGRIEILREGMRVAILRTPGCVVGEMSLFLETPATATVRALEPSTFYVADNPLEFLQAHPDVLLLVSRRMAFRLDAASRYLADVKHQLQGCSDHVGMVDGVMDKILHRDLKSKGS